MSEANLRRVDELLTELVELVETARSLPMSASCVVPREHTLDLLDDLREVLPPEMAEAAAWWPTATPCSTTRRPTPTGWSPRPARRPNG